MGQNILFIILLKIFTNPKDNDEVAMKVENRLRKRQYLHIEREIMELLLSCKHTCKLLETGATDTYYYM